MCEFSLTKPYMVLGRQRAEMLKGTMYEISGRVRITQEYCLQKRARALPRRPHRCVSGIIEPEQAETDEHA
jgi:hypothetical protein